MLDDQMFQSKPSKPETIQINNRITQSPADITPEELANQLIKGRTFTPAYLNKKIKGLVRRKKECWTSQEIMCIDFDNEIEIPNPDYPHKSKIKSLRVKKVSLTLEEAIHIFKDTAMFIYTSFSHKPEHPKFRVVFAFDQVVSNPYDMDDTLSHYKKKYPQSDQQCYERARMFYGGRDLHVLDYSNRIPVIQSKKSKTDSNCAHDSTKDLVSSLVYRRHNYPNINMIELIRKKDKNKIKELLNKNNILCHTYSETVEYIKKQDIGELLGLSPHDICPFHPDKSPSASIFKNEFTNHYLFHCHSDNCTFGTGTMSKVIERLTGLNKVQSLKFIRDIYNIEFHQTDWQKEQMELIDENIRYLHSGDLEIEYPKQYKIMRRYIPDLISFLTLSKEYIAPEHYTVEQQRALFYTSLSHFAKFSGKLESDKKRLGEKIALFTFFSYIHKLREPDIPEKLLTRAKFELMKNKKASKSYNLISFYEIPSYSEDVLAFAEKKAEEYINNHFTMRGWNYEMLFRALGEEEAFRVYPQMNVKKIKEKSHVLSREMELAAMELIESRGWASEKDIINTIKINIHNSSQAGLKRQIKTILGELVQKYGLIRKHANNDLLKELGIGEITSEKGNPSYPYILFKNNNK